MKENLTHFIHGLRQGNRMSQLINLRRNSSTLPLRRSLILLSALILSVGQMWGADYYLRGLSGGNWDASDANKMTAGTNNIVWMSHATDKGYIGFKITKGTTYDTNYGQSSGDVSLGAPYTMALSAAQNAYTKNWSAGTYYYYFNTSTYSLTVYNTIEVKGTIMSDGWGSTTAMIFQADGSWKQNCTASLTSGSSYYFKIHANGTYTGYSSKVSCTNGTASAEYGKDGDNIKVIPNSGGTAVVVFHPEAGGTINIYCPYQISYNKGANGTGTIASGSKTWNSSFTLSSSTFTRAGYTQDGWSTSDGGDKVYNLGGSYTTNADLTLYPHWVENISTVTLVASPSEKGTFTIGGDAATSTTAGVTTTRSVTAEPISGYHFVSWSISGGATISSTTDNPTTIIGDGTGDAATLTATFEEDAIISLTVGAGTNISSVSGSTSPVTLGSKYDISATPETGYAFSSWTATPAANATFDDATSASTKVQVNNGSVTVTANATEVMSTLSTSNHFDVGDPGYSAPAVAGSRTTVGYVTEAEITATAAGTGYTFVGWTLTNCTRTDGGAATAGTITIRSNGDGEDVSVVANYEEDLSTDYVLKGGSAFGGTAWSTEFPLTKYSGFSTQSVAYYKCNLTKIEEESAANSNYNFKIFKKSTSTYYGLNSEGDYWYMRSTTGEQTMTTSGQDIQLRADRTDEYLIKVDYSTPTSPKITVTFPGRSVVGAFNEWNVAANEFTNGVASVADLAENTDYQFKIYDGVTWYGCNATIRETEGNYIFYNDQGNCKLHTSTAGTYVFGWNEDTHVLSVIFPEEQAKMKFNSGQYIYFDTRRLGNTGDGWNAAEFTARFWVKNYATGEDVANSTQTKALTLEDGVYYTRLPENENIGQIQINRLNPENTSEIWCTANKVFAFERANANQNCLQEETGKESWCNEWTPQWTTYCPPVRSVSLTDNGTIEHTLYGGDGTEGSPFLIKTGEHIEVMGSAVSAVSDANMTAYYQFKKDDANVGEASSTNTASITASSVSGTKEKITVVAYNVFNSASGTSATSAAIYYEVRTPYTISYNKGSGDGISGSHVNMRKLKGVNHHLPYEVFTRTGYRQTGWTTSDGGAQTHELGGYYTDDADQTFYPVWTAITYTITLDNYGGEGGSSSVTATYGQSAGFGITNPTRDGYTFGGWYSGYSYVVIDAEGNLKSGVSGFTNAEGQWTRSSNCTLKAIWKHNSSLGKYNFRYGWQNDYYANEWNDVNFGEATDDHMRTANFTIPTVSGYYYVGYDGEYCSKGINGASGSSTQSGLNGLGLYPGIYGSITPSSTGAVGRLIIWDNSSSNNLGVRFQPSGYGLTYASGTQAFSKADDHLWQTATMTLSSEDIAGTFKVGLATATEGTYVDCSLSKADNASALNGRKDKLVSEQSYPAIPNMAEGQKGRFVIWDDSGDQWYLSFLPVYSVTYDANGGTGEAPAAATEYRTNERPEVLDNTFTHEGYSFEGWNTEANGTGIGYKVGGHLAKIGANVTLYAQWAINSHAITYTAPSNGSYTIQVAEDEAVSTSTEADYGQTVTLSATSAPCYVFNGWSVTGATVADASALTTTFTMPNADVTIEALFVRENIAIGKTAKAGWSRRGDCPNQNDREVPDKAVDGDTGSDFISYANTNNALAWWAVDLGASYRLNSFDAVWNYGRTPSHYLIQVMTSTPSDFADDVVMSDANWITAVEVNEPQTEETGGNQHAFGAISARYVRLVSVERPEFGLSEFRVYADASSSDPVVTPTLVSAAVYSDLSAGSATLTLTATDHNGAALHTFLLQDQTGKHYRVTTDGSDHATLSGLNDQRYVFTVWAIEEGNTSSSSMVIVGESTFSSLTNLALNKPAYAVRYRENNSNYAPGKANDGNLGSHWNAGSDSGEAIDEEDRDNIWWYVDLQDQYSIKYISMFWTLASANSFIMQVRKDAPSVAEANDDSAWETFLDYSGTQSTGEGEGDANLYGDVSGNKAAFLFTPKGRYLRFRAKDAPHWDWGVQVRELRVFGNGYLPIDDVAPVLSAASYNSVTGDNSGVKFNVTATDNLTDPVVDYRVIDGQGRIHNVTADEGVITITGLTSGRNQLVTIYALDEAGNKSAGREVEFDYLNPNENLALNKTCWASGTANQAGELKENANNGSIDDGKAKYFYGAGENAWWIVDLGDTYQLKNIECFFDTDKTPSAYKLYGRQNDPGDALRSTNDGWVELADKTSDINAGTTESDKNEHDISYPYAVRYVKFYATSSEIKLIELRVFGKAFATPDETAPAWTDAACGVTSAVNHTITMTLEATDANPENIYDFVINVDNGTSNKDYARSTTALSNVITIEDATFIEPCETYTITAKCYDHVGNENTKVFANVNTTVSGNIALGKTTEAGTTEGGGDGSSRAVDGNTGTEWSGNSNEKEGGVNQWLKVDLGKNYSINEIRISWGANPGTWPIDYELQSSYDGVNYRTFIHRTSADGARNNTYSELSVHGRYIRVWANVYGNLYGMCISEIEVYGECYDGEADDEPNDFTGGGATNAWTDLSNWPKGVLPGETDEVHLLAPMVIPDGTTVKIAKLVIATGGKQAGGMAEATGHLTIAPTAALIVSGEIKRCADASAPATQSATTAADITIQSSDAGNGALVFSNGTGEEANAATVEMYSKATTEGADWTWQYIAAPAAVSALSNYYGGYLYKWNSGWEAVGNSDNMELFAGYCVSYPTAEHIFTIEGALAPTTEQSITVPAGKSMVIGNSWTAPIQISQMTAGDFTNVDQTVYLYNTGNDESGEAGTDEGDRYAAGTYVPVPIAETATVGVTKVSSLQGFFVKNNSGSAGTLSLSYSKHVRPSGGNSVVNGAMHAPKRVADETDRPAVLKMKVSGSQYDDRLILLEREDFTTGYDAGWDGDKMGDVATSPRITTTREDGTADAVAALPDLEGTLINFRAASTDDQYTLYFDYETEDAEPLYLLDLTNNAYTRVETGGSYTFVTTDKADHKRFALTRYRAPQITTGVEDALEDNGQGKAVKFIENDKLYILLNGVLYDGTGKRAK